MRKVYLWVSILVILGLCIYATTSFIQIQNIMNQNQLLQKELIELRQEKEKKDALLQEYYGILSEELDVNRDSENLMYHPKQEFDAEYKFEEAYSSISGIKSYLDSFKKLTEASRINISKEQQANIGNLDWSIQNIAFENTPNSILIIINETKYILKKIDFELAIKKFELGELDIEELNQKRDLYRESKIEFEEFAGSMGFAD